MRNLWHVFGILVFAFALLILIIPSADATNSLTYTIANVSGSRIYVEQGDTIYHGDVADLTGVYGWDCTVAWWSGGEGAVSVPPDQTVDVCSFSHRVIITENMFPSGSWWKWSGEWERSGNNLAFYVGKGSRPVINDTVNYTYEVPYQAAQQVREAKLPNLPVARGDYVVAHGNALNITFNGTSAQVWLFADAIGGYDWLPPRYGVNQTSFSENEIETLSPGNYTVFIQNQGTNRVFDVMYDNQSKSRVRDGHDEVIWSVFRPTQQSNVSVLGWTPILIKKALINMLDTGMSLYQVNNISVNLFDDTYEMKTLVVEEQNALIQSIDEISRGNKTREATVNQITGYTSIAGGDDLIIVLDWDDQNVRTLNDFSWVTTALSDGDPGHLRQFNVMIPLYYSEMAVGEHFLSVITPDGTRSTVPFHIMDMPEGQIAPEARLRFINSSPFIPTPTPEIVIQEKIVEKERIIYVTMTPVPTTVPLPPVWATIPWWAYLVALIVVIFVIWRTLL